MPIFRFFTNEFDTRTQGVDVVASFAPAELGGETEFNLAFNHTATRVTDYNPEVLNETRIEQLEDALPGTRWTAGARRSWGSLSILGRLSYYAGGSIRATTGPIRASTSWTWRPTTR